MTNDTTTELVNLPAVTLEDIDLLADALSSLYHGVEKYVRTSRSVAIQAVNDGDAPRALMYEEQASNLNQRRNAIANLAAKLGVGIEGDE